MLAAYTIKSREDGSRYVLAYRYDSRTGEFIGFDEADESPLEPGVFLLPAYATATAPPASQGGFIRTWNGSAWTQVAIPPEPEPVPPAPPTADEARVTRNNLLFGSDYTQLADVPLANKAAWVTYRQALRDVPAQGGFPENITWPTPPNYIKS